MDGLLKDKVAISGLGYTQQGKVAGRTAVSFHVEACRNAINDAKIDKSQVDALFIYRHFDAIGNDLDVTAFTVSEQLGINPKVISQETYCTRSWLCNAVALLTSGVCKNVLISYGDNARSARRSFAKEVKNNKAEDELATFGDLSTLSKYAMLAQRAMYEYGTGPDVWKEISIAQRQWACLNEIAGMYNKPLTTEDYLANEFVVEPFRMLDATPITDGGRAMLLTLADNVADKTAPLVTITGFGSANNTLSPYRINVDTQDEVVKKAADDAFKMAGISLKDIDACQLYDCFTYTVEATLRAYGFFNAHDAKQWLTRQRIGPGGEMPVNTSGGMLSEAYFMGLTPITEAVLQLRGNAGKRQLGGEVGGKKPQFMLCSDNGAVFQSHCTLILQRRG